MTKIIAIHGGGDWYDASADYVILPDGMDLGSERERWLHYNKHRDPTIGYMSFVDWLLRAGARAPNDDELEIFDDT